MDWFFRGGTAVPGRPIAFHLEVTPPPPSDRLLPGQQDSARLGVGGPTAFQSPSVHGEDVKCPLVKDVGMKVATAEDIRAS